MVDITQLVARWRDGAREEWQVATELLENGRVRQALFFTHLALEKALKAHVCRHTGDLAPRTHNLVRLAEVAELGLSPAQTDVLAETNEFVLAGRYPDVVSTTPTLAEAQACQDRAQEVFLWLIQQL
jgi:HEPN domain-containing protein